MLPLPSAVGYAESGDPLRTMSHISNRVAKGDRLLLAHPLDADGTLCAPGWRSQGSGRCAAFHEAD